MSAPTHHRRALLCAIAVVVVLAHAGGLAALGLPQVDRHGLQQPVAQALRVRHVVLPVPAPATLPPVAAPTPERPRASRGPAPGVPGVAAAPAPGTADAGTAPAAASELPARPADGQGAAGVPTSIDVPVYATRLPPAGRWLYRLQRGLAVGEAELQWAPQADARYELRLWGRIAGATLLDWVSQGQLDAHGVAPERFALRRRGRDAQAANFQREAGKITFSGPTHEAALPPGAQDRLSWLVQLPAVVAAAPEQFAAGASIQLYVAGARGDADVWTFTVQGTETVAGAALLKLVREPRRLYDTRVEIWLDPAEHYLPLRAVQTPSGGGAALELQRERPLR